MNPEEVARHRADRARLKREHQALFEEVSALFFRFDPVGLNFETNADEYDPEVGTILPRLRECRSPDDAQRVVHEEFTRWFTAETAGSAERYQAVSVALWGLWQRHHSRGRDA
jgi:hypothetical protein